MRVISPLSNLSDVLNQVKNSAAQYGSTLGKNEAATRAVLIDPILRSLGWDTSNTYMVEVEKTLAQTRADYALYDSNSDVKVIVEAKPLGHDLTHPGVYMSLVNYAFTFGLEDIFLTDGLIWYHFTSFQPGNRGPTRVLDLNQDDPVDCAAYLVQRLDAAKFWPDEQSIDTLTQRVAQLESALSSLQQQLSQVSATTGQTSTSPAPVTPPTGSGAVSKTSSGPTRQLVPLVKLDSVTGTRPTLLQLPDGSLVPVSRWSDVVRECCKYALAAHPQIPIPLADSSGRKVSLLGTVRPARGLSYVEVQHNGRDIFIYTNYDANKSVANALHVLKQLPASGQLQEAAVEYENKG